MDRPGLEETALIDWTPIFQFDSGQLRLRNTRTGRQCALTRNEALLLDALIAGVSTKADLIDEVWTRHGTVVTENSYYQLVSLLRKSFSSIDLPGTVVTVPRKGLALTGRPPSDRGLNPASNADSNVGPAGALNATLNETLDATPKPAADLSGRPCDESRAQALKLKPAETGTDEPSTIMIVDASTDRARHPAANEAQRGPSLMRDRIANFITRVLRWFVKSRTLAAIGVSTGATMVAGMALVTAAMPGPQANMWFPVEGAQWIANRSQSLTVDGASIIYSLMSETMAQRIWRDIGARVDIPPEQRKFVFMTLTCNRYAVLACSGRPELSTTRCSTVTESL